MNSARAQLDVEEGGRASAEDAPLTRPRPVFLQAPPETHLTAVAAVVLIAVCRLPPRSARSAPGIRTWEFRRVCDLLAYIFFRAFSFVCWLLGARGSAALGCLLGMAISLLDNRRGRTHRNMARAVGPERARALLPKYYEHVGLLAVEFVRIWHPGRHDFADRIAPDGVERLKAALASSRGALIITGHIGNWELGGQCLARNGVPLHAVYRALKNPYLDKLLRRVRKESGMFLHEKQAGARTMMRAVRQHETVGLMMDQDGSGAGVFVPFFGELGSTLSIAAQIARRTGTALIPMSSYRVRSRAFHRLRVGPEIEVADTGDEELDVLLTTRNCNRALEEAILEHPAQWLWRHRRWQTRARPEDARSWEAAAARLPGAREAGAGAAAK